MCWKPNSKDLWWFGCEISQGHWPGFRVAGCNICIVIAVQDERPMFGRTWAFLTDTPTDTYRYLSYMVSCSLKDMPHTLTNLIQFHLAISGRGSLPMNCWTTCFTLWDGQVQQEHKGTASRQRKLCQHLLETPTQGPELKALKELARKAKPGQARENTQSASNPGLTRDQHPITMEQPLKPWSLQIVKTQEIQNLHNR